MGKHRVTVSFDVERVKGSRLFTYNERGFASSIREALNESMDFDPRIRVENVTVDRSEEILPTVYDAEVTITYRVPLGYLNPEDSRNSARMNAEEATKIGRQYVRDIQVKSVKPVEAIDS